MIHFNFTLSNPWTKNSLKSYCNKAWMVAKHKCIEIEVSWTDYTVVGFDFEFHIRRDHAGLRTDVTLFGLCFSFNFYDTRHWDRETDDWNSYE